MVRIGAPRNDLGRSFDTDKVRICTDMINVAHRRFTRTPLIRLADVEPRNQRVWGSRIMTEAGLFSDVCMYFSPRDTEVSG